VKALIWKSKLHNKLKKYLWRIASNLLPTYISLVRFNLNLDTCCCLCEQAPETSLHLFWDCALARALWFGLEWNIKTDIFPLASLVDLIELLLSPPLDWGLDSSVMGRFLMVGAVIVDQIWKERNRKVHEGFVPQVEQITRILAMSKKVIDAIFWAA
jgi:TM2 domain-containing membrane protein YozV